jgi:hypothetical protein
MQHPDVAFLGITVAAGPQDIARSDLELNFPSVNRRALFNGDARPFREFMERVPTVGGTAVILDRNRRLKRVIGRNEITEIPAVLTHL